MRMICATALAAALALTACGEDLTDAEYMQRAEQHVANDNVGAALIEARNAVRVNPDNPDARRLLGELNMEVRDYAAAAKEFERARDLGQNDPELYENIALAYMRGDDFEGVLAAADEAAAVGVATPLLDVLRGGALMRQGSLEEAFPYLRDGIAADGSEIAYAELSRYYIIRADPERADETVAAGLDAFPQSAVLHFLRGEILMQQQSYEDALEAYRASLAIDSDLLIPRLAEARALIALQNFEEADARLAEIEADAPNFGGAALYRAITSLELQRWERAVEYAERVLTVAENNPTSLYISAVANYYRNNFESAHQRISQYLASSPDDVAAQKLLASAKLQIGDVAGARAILEQLGEANAADADIAQLLSQSALLAGDSGDAIRYLEDAVRSNPEDRAIRARLARAQIESGDLRSGIDELQRLIEQGDEFAGLNSDLAQAYLREGDFERAREAARQLQRDFPNNPAGLVLEGAAVAQMGDAEEALSLFARAHDLAPGNAAAALTYARALAATGDADGAVRVLERALEANPEEQRLLVEAANLLSRRNNIVGAIEWLERGVAAWPQADEIRLMLARAYILRLRWREALDQAQTVLDRAPTTLAALEARAIAQTGLGDVDGAIATYRQITDLSPETDRAFRRIARLYLNRGEFLNALREYDRALRVNPNFIGVRGDLVEALIGRDNARAEREIQEFANRGGAPAEVAALRAALLMDRGDRAGAEEILEEAIAASPQRIEPRVMLARSRLASGDPRGALSVIEGFERAGLNFTPLFDVKGRAELAIGKNRRAAVSLARFARARPSVDAWTNVAIAAESYGDFEVARVAVDSALRLDPENIRARFVSGRIMAASGDVGGARAELDRLRAAGADPRDLAELEGVIAMAENRFDDAAELLAEPARARGESLTALRLATAESRRGETARAEAWLKAWLDAFPQDWAVRSYLAGAYLAAGRFADAASQYAALAEFEPTNPDVLNNLAWTLWRAGDLGAARSRAEDAFALAPDNAGIKDTLGGILLEAGETDRASRLITEAYEASPEDPNIALNYARVLRLRGERDEAAAIVETALQSPQLADRSAAEALLDELRR